MKKLVIVGSGGFAKEVEWLVERINEEKPTWEFLGFIDNDTSPENVFGDDEFIVNYPEEIYVAVAIGTGETRRKIYQLYKQNPYIKFANLIDPSVRMSKRVILGEDNIICAGTILTVDIAIGSHNIINLDCTVGHDVVIENYVTINPSVNISGNVTLRNGVNIGTGTQIIQGKEIRENSIVGAGAVVSEDLPKNCTAVGVPAKVIKIMTE